ncbi:MAG: RNase adapter RapZ [Xylanivirga thermophila]|jgi:RNase adapter protein RapZ|uniref:RNase adapter RapZ n=1 Tax=Xylanivirga thermophila TaxID=2496273 RepID=UPI00101DDD83|nr:RNase adapter RapZ [Xylanivirga thermophila]
MRFIVVTGLSGAGKTMTIRYLEDMGFFCIDNLPPKLIPKFAELCYQSEGRVDKVAIVVDIRGGGFFDDLFECLYLLKEEGYSYEILYLDASDDVLIKRYKESRRMHPLVKEGRIIQGIHLEREKLKTLKERANYIIDTSTLHTSQLKSILNELFSDDKDAERLIISVISFGFKNGMLLEGDLIFDVRFLPNPFYVEELKEHTGLECDVRDYIFSFPETGQFLGKLLDMLDFLIPYYIREGKYQLVIGIGCTGGQHRSVAIAEELYNILKDKGHKVTVEHRDIK